jgi:CCR4-NOT transcriptional regulation complex NOT5 subunit
MKVRLVKVEKNSYLLQVKSLFGWNTIKIKNFLDTNERVFTSKKEVFKFINTEFKTKNLIIYPMIKMKKGSN